MERILSEEIKDIVLDKILQFEQLVTEFESDMPRHGPVSLLLTVKTVLKVLRMYYERKLKDLAAIKEDNRRKEKLYVNSRIVLVSIFIMHEKLLPFLNPGQLTSIPIEILGASQSLAGKFEDMKELELSFSPNYDYQFSLKAFYGVVDNLIDSLKSDVPESFFRKIKKKASNQGVCNSFAFVGYPWIERRSLLLPSLMVHEIGHLKESRENLRREFLPERLDQQRVENLVKTIANTELLSKDSGSGSRVKERQLTLSLVYPEDKIRQKVVETCLAITENWVKEFVVDLLALHLLGPGYFFSFLELVYIVGMDSEGSDTHPSFTWRLKVMMDELEDMGYLLSDFKDGKIRDLLKSWRKRLLNRNVIPNKKFREIAYYSLLKSLPEMHKGIRDRSRTYSYNPHRYYEKVLPIVRVIKRGILPVQRWDRSRKKFDTFEELDIINAGWYVYNLEMSSFYKLVSAKDKKDQQNARQTLFNLILKAIDSAQTTKRWARKERIP